MLGAHREAEGVMVWDRFAGDTLGNSFKINGTLNQHGYHSILQQLSFWFACRWPIICFSTTPNTLPGSLRVTKKKMMECSTR